MQHGDFVEIDYVGRLKLTGEIFDLTNEDVAKQEKLHDPKAPYGPALVIVGSSMTVHGVMKELEKMEVGEERSFEVAPSEGFGIRDPRLIKILPASKFIENKINPVPGAYFDIDGMQAKVQSVSGGRVRVDFNNPLAGKALDYSVKVLRKIDGEKEKIEALLKYYMVEHSEIRMVDKGVEVHASKPVSPVAKRIVGDMITRWIKGMEKVEFMNKHEPGAGHDAKEEKEAEKTGQEA